MVASFQKACSARSRIGILVGRKFAKPIDDGTEQQEIKNDPDIPKLDIHEPILIIE